MVGSQDPVTHAGRVGEGNYCHPYGHHWKRLERAFQAPTFPRKDCMTHKLITAYLKQLSGVLIHMQEGSGKEITVTHMDTPGNDWRELFKQAREHPQSYRDAGDVYTYAYAGTFYEQCFPTASLSLAYSSIALHWASRGMPKVLGFHF